MTWLEDPPLWLRPGSALAPPWLRPGSALAPPCLLLCFVSVIVWTENKNFTYIWLLTALLVLFSQWNNLSDVGGLCVLRATAKKSSTFWGKKYIRVTWLEDVLTSKWPGSYAALVPPLTIVSALCYVCGLMSWTDIFVRVSGGETPPFRPPISPNDQTNDPQLIQLMRDCWDEYSTLRPDFSTIRSRFLVINKGKYDKVLMSLRLMNDRYEISSEQPVLFV